jgi:hypothetical protein
MGGYQNGFSGFYGLFKGVIGGVDGNTSPDNSNKGKVRSRPTLVGRAKLKH